MHAHSVTHFPDSTSYISLLILSFDFQGRRLGGPPEPAKVGVQRGGRTPQRGFCEEVGRGQVDSAHLRRAAWALTPLRVHLTTAREPGGLQAVGGGGRLESRQACRAEGRAVPFHLSEPAKLIEPLFCFERYIPVFSW